MLTVAIHLDHIYVHVELASLEMDSFAQVSNNLFRITF
jgi:hypothetical protein